MRILQRPPRSGPCVKVGCNEHVSDGIPTPSCPSAPTVYVRQSAGRSQGLRSEPDEALADLGQGLPPWPALSPHSSHMGHGSEPWPPAAPHLSQSAAAAGAEPTRCASLK